MQGCFSCKHGSKSLIATPCAIHFIACPIICSPELYTELSSVHCYAPCCGPRCARSRSWHPYPYSHKYVINSICYGIRCTAAGASAWLASMGGDSGRLHTLARLAWQLAMATGNTIGCVALELTAADARPRMTLGAHRQCACTAAKRTAWSLHRRQRSDGWHRATSLVSVNQQKVQLW